MAVIKLYVHKVAVPGSRFEEYALLSKLSGEFYIKYLRFIDPVVDDDGTVFPFVKHDYVLFIEGLAVSANSLVDFLSKVLIAEECSEYPVEISTKSSHPVLLDLVNILGKIKVLRLVQSNMATIEIYPKLGVETLWEEFYNMLRYSGLSNLTLENEVVDF